MERVGRVNISFGGDGFASNPPLQLEGDLVGEDVACQAIRDRSVLLGSS